MQLAQFFWENLVTLVQVGRNRGENKRFPPSRIKFGRSSRSRPLPRNKLIKLFPNHSKKKVDANWKILGGLIVVNEQIRNVVCVIDLTDKIVDTPYIHTLLPSRRKTILNLKKGLKNQYNSGTQYFHL